MLLWFGKGKSLHGRAAEAFIYITEHPYEPIHLISSLMLERFTVILHHKVSTLLVVSRELFCKKNKSLENLPPTQDALLQHARRAVFQTNIWTSSLQNIQDIPTPEDWGWRKQENSWKPIWMTLPEAASACNELIRCGCKSTRGCSTRCKCAKAGLSCTDLCSCTCEI